MHTQIRRRIVAVLAVATLGLAASIATAGVEPGHEEGDPAATSPELPSTPPEPAPAPAAPAPEPPPIPEVDTADTSDPTIGTGPLVRAAGSVYAAVSRGSRTAIGAPAPAAKRSRLAPRSGQPSRPSARVFWIWGALPDPTPPSLRLDAGFARQLRLTAKREAVDWALVLAVLRARGRLGAVPAGPLGLKGAAALVADAAARTRPDARTPGFARGWTVADRGIAAARARRDWYRASVSRISRDARFTDRAVALALYYRAVGLAALQRGLEATKPRLAARLLRDERISIYPGGRVDIEAGRIDIRVLTVIAYLTATYGQITVSSLETGHGLFSRPGVISAHAYGRAVDVTALAGVAIQGNQQPGSITEDAVAATLRLPTELLPQQVISLLGFGGPSLALADHYDHIHVGY